MNPQHVAFSGQLVQESSQQQIPRIRKKGISILSYYFEERQGLSDLFRRLNLPGVRVYSVDSAQGSESSVVTLSGTRTGYKYGLGFLMDRNMACKVAILY